MFGQYYRIAIGLDYTMKILDWIRIAKTSDPFNTTARILLLSDTLMSCFVACKNGWCLDIRRRESALDERVSAEWSRCQTPWHDVQERAWLLCDEVQQVGCLRGLEGCPLA